jgi:hypothetical protein
MIATPRFVFLHLHKSGGTFVNECLLRFVPGARQLGYHLPRSRIPAEFAALPCLGFVRNPWGYYVSWYSFQAGLPRQNALFTVLSDGGRLGFAGTIRNMLALADDAARLEAAVAALPAEYTNRGLNLPGFVLREIGGTGLGFYSFLYRYMFGAEDANLHVGRMESLRTDLPALLARVGEPVGEPLLRHIATAAPSNSSRHGAIAGYYDAELRDLVAQRDAPVIERFSYRLDP